jgi:prevent-host-death family protein
MAPWGGRMRTVCAADAKNKFGELVDMARAAPVAITKYDRTVLVVLAIEEHERLARLDASIALPESPIDESDH